MLIRISSIGLASHMCAAPPDSETKLIYFPAPHNEEFRTVLEEKREAQQTLDELFSEKLLPQDDTFFS